MSALTAYINQFVEPTFRDFDDDKIPRRAFLAAVGEHD